MTKDLANRAEDGREGIDPRQAVELEVATKQWYVNYYRKYGADRNDLRENRGVLFQLLASEASLVRAVSAISHDPAHAKVLDVGCGGASDFYQLLRVGYRLPNSTGIDIQLERLEQAKALYPQMGFIYGDASKSAFTTGSFDLVYESGMFATLPDDQLRGAIAREMVRVCKAGGYLLLVDWRTPKPFDANYKALTKRELFRLFEVDSVTKLVGIYKGALVPPLGRFFSAHLSSVYFLIGRLVPILVGQVTFVLKKRQEA